MVPFAVHALSISEQGTETERWNLGTIRWEIRGEERGPVPWRSGYRAMKERRAFKDERQMMNSIIIRPLDTINVVSR